MDTATNGTLDVVRLRSSDPAQHFLCVARLHLEGILHGALPMFGQGFLTELYRQLANAPGAGVWVAMSDGRVAGFIVGCTDMRRAFRSVLMRGGLRLIWAAAPRLWTPALWKKLPSVVAYPFTSRFAASSSNQETRSSGDREMRGAELLSMAVDPGFRGIGIGRRLVETMENELLRPSGISEYLVTTNRAERTSNLFYASVGFHPERTFRHHDLTLQTYRKRLGAKADQSAP